MKRIYQLFVLRAATRSLCVYLCPGGIFSRVEVGEDKILIDV